MSLKSKVPKKRNSTFVAKIDKLLLKWKKFALALYFKAENINYYNVIYKICYKNKTV